MLQMIDCLNWALQRLWVGCLYLMEIVEAEWMGEDCLGMELSRRGIELGQKSSTISVLSVNKCDGPDSRSWILLWHRSLGIIC